MGFLGIVDEYEGIIVDYILVLFLFYSLQISLSFILA